MTLYVELLLYSSTFCSIKDVLEINLCKQGFCLTLWSRRVRRVMVCYIILYHFIICIILLVRVIFVLSFSSRVQTTCWSINFKFSSHFSNSFIALEFFPNFQKLRDCLLKCRHLVTVENRDSLAMGGLCPCLVMIHWAWAGESLFSQSVVTRVSQCLLLHPFLCHTLLALGFGTSDLVAQLLFT